MGQMKIQNQSTDFSISMLEWQISAKRRQVCEYGTQFFVSIFDIMSPFSSALKWCFPLGFKLCIFFFFVQKININNSRIPLVSDQMNIQFQVGLLKKKKCHPLVIQGLPVDKSHYRVPLGRERRQLTAAQMHCAPLGLEITPKLSPIMISLCAGRIR